MAVFVFAGIFIVAGIIVFFAAPKSFKQRGLVGLGCVVVGIIMVFSVSLIVVDAGEVGVVVVFGTVQSGSLYSGINVVPPYAEVYKYPTRVMEHTQSEDNLIEARVVDGLTVGIDCTTLYRIDPAMAAEIYTKYATTLDVLESKILVPTLRTVIRDQISKYNSEQIYSSKREEVASLIAETLSKDLKSKGILIDSFLIRGIKLPAEVDTSIQLKISAQQESEAMKYKMQKAQQEADIKVIEANGLAKAQSIINSTLSSYYLQHEAIQAYLELAKSPNTTFVVMPTTANGTGVPLILNSGK